jgi:hypothetical protein
LQGQGQGVHAFSPQSCLTLTPTGRRVSIFLNFLVPKPAAPREEDLSKGMLEAIDMGSYRAEKRAVQQIQFADADATIERIPR